MKGTRPALGERRGKSPFFVPFSRSQCFLFLPPSRHTSPGLLNPSLFGIEATAGDSAERAATKEFERRSRSSLPPIRRRPP